MEAASPYFETFYGPVMELETCSKVVWEILVSEKDNKRLISSVFTEEVIKAMFNLDMESLAGPDGLPGDMFQEMWGAIKNDMWRAVKGIFDKERAVNINQTNIYANTRGKRGRRF